MSVSLAFRDHGVDLLAVASVGCQGGFPDKKTWYPQESSPMVALTRSGYPYNFWYSDVFLVYSWHFGNRFGGRRLPHSHSWSVSQDSWKCPEAQGGGARCWKISKIYPNKNDSNVLKSCKESVVILHSWMWFARIWASKCLILGDGFWPIPWAWGKVHRLADVPGPKSMSHERRARTVKLSNTPCNGPGQKLRKKKPPDAEKLDVWKFWQDNHLYIYIHL